VNHARHLHAGHLGHAEIDDNDVGLERSGFLNGFQTIYGLAADLPTLVRFEQFARATARLWVVVYYKNSSHSSLARFCKSAAMLGSGSLIISCCHFLTTNSTWCGERSSFWTCRTI
jgi:hypothetical protein